MQTPISHTYVLYREIQTAHMQFKLLFTRKCKEVKQQQQNIILKR